ncbi:MAG: hypothetical protein CSA81_12515 [Acidobacteria bacterium]|nr:MAG: hypothetical protein CSA81_12515 [Acidobacteriota bacterium]
MCFKLDLKFVVKLEAFMLPEYFEFQLAPKVIYGVGVVDQIPNNLLYLGSRRALLVTDLVLVQTGAVRKVIEALESSQIEIAAVFDEVPPNSTIKTVEDCSAAIQENKCNLIIAVGGGSVIDTAKVANLLAVKGGRLSDHMGAYLLEKSEKLHPAVIIPTTAGTGSEVTKVAVIADTENQVKLPFAEDQFLPELAVLDPELTETMPGKLTAATGMDALTHAIEAYVDKEWSPASDAMALHAMKLISKNILIACARPEDMQARGAMLVGSFLAGVAFSHSMVGMTHGIAHALGSVYHIPHGLANALVLPEVMEYNLEERMERYVDVGYALGVQYPQYISGSKSMIQNGSLLTSLFKKAGPTPEVKSWLSDKVHQAQGLAGEALSVFGFVDDWVRRQVAKGAIEKVRTLNRQLAYLTEMPLNLKDAGIDDQLAKLETVVQTAMEDGAMLYNPVEPQRKAVRAIVQTVYGNNDKPLCVPVNQLGQSSEKKGSGSFQNVFSDSETVYRVIGGFFERLKEHEKMGPELAKTKLLIQFIYKKPSAVITIDARGDELAIYHGDCDLTPEVTMSMNADFAHLFWHGKANLITALTKREVKARGNVPKTIKLLPVLNPAYALYPVYLKEIGFELNDLK